jgi:signal peptide peptidase SppA
MTDLSRVIAEPLLVAPHAAGAFAASVGAKHEPFDHALDCAAVFGPGVMRVEEKPFAFDSQAGVAIIPVRGTLLNRSNWSYSGATGYQFITGLVSAAAADPQVKAILLDVDSFGGEAAGCFECAADLRTTLRAAGKPSLAVVNSNAYSAGYALAVAADQISVIPSGGAGGAGVVTMHADYSKNLAENGVKVTFVFAGKHKVDGNPYESLPDATRADMQARIDQRYEAFVAHVAEMRGLDPQVVRDTEARIYSAADALALGLIDQISTAQGAYTTFCDSLLARPSTTQLEATTVPDLDQAAIASAERARIKAIITGAEATGRTDLANKLAFDTDMSAEMASGILAAAPVAAAPTAPRTDPLAAAMSTAGTPGILPQDDSAGTTAPDDASATVARLLSFQRRKGA